MSCYQAPLFRILLCLLNNRHDNFILSPPPGQAGCKGVHVFHGMVNAPFPLIFHPLCVLPSPRVILLVKSVLLASSVALAPSSPSFSFLPPPLPIPRSMWLRSHRQQLTEGAIRGGLYGISPLPSLACPQGGVQAWKGCASTLITAALRIAGEGKEEVKAEEAATALPRSAALLPEGEENVLAQEVQHVMGPEGHTSRRKRGPGRKTPREEVTSSTSSPPSSVLPLGGEETRAREGPRREVRKGSERVLRKRKHEEKAGAPQAVRDEGGRYLRTQREEATAMEDDEFGRLAAELIPGTGSDGEGGRERG
ncbi:hypothetical protein Naga_101503g1, partial [Nannochloropsis gaditana]